jgi:hypothetical protein
MRDIMSLKGTIMSAELSPELRKALTAAPNGPLEVIDPVTKKAYVLVSADLYQRVQALLGDEGDVVRDMSGLLADLAPEDWEDAANYDSPQP